MLSCEPGIYAFDLEIAMSLALPQKLPSERRFGLTLMLVLLALGGYEAYKHDAAIYLLLGLIGVILGVVAMTSPLLLSPLNRWWFRLGQLLGKIVSPIVLGLIFFVILTPISMIARLLGRDELHLRRRKVSSYWIERTSKPIDADSFRHQY